MLKICLIAPSPPPYGGISNWVSLIQHYCKNTGNNEIYIINTSQKKRDLDGRTLWDRIFVQGFVALKINYSLKKHIKEKHPDVIHITTSGQFAILRDILLLFTAKQLKIPTVYHVRFGRIFEIAENNTIEWKIFSIAARLARVVMVIDKKTMITIKERIGKIDLEYIPNPIDLSHLALEEVEKKRIVIFIGWIIKTKGVEELLKAWEQVHKDNSEWTLWLVGPFHENYLKYLEHNFSFKGVLCKGEQAHGKAMEMLNGSEIFILPSYTEGFPNVVLEAMAVGKAIVASNVGAIPEMLNENCGYLIEPKNIVSIVDILNILIHDDCERTNIGKNAKIKVSNEYDIKIIYDQYMVCWKRISKS